jgi:hypothetical protein
LGAFAIIAACSQHVGISKWKRRRLVVAPQKRPKLAVADATGELHTIEQFGRPLGIKNNSDLADLQIGSKHVIFIAPLKRGRFEVRYGEARDVLLVSRQPLLDTARLLIRVGCRPDAIIAMRRRTSISDDLRAPLGVAAKYTVDETKTVFAKMEAVFPVGGRPRGCANTKVRHRYSRNDQFEREAGPPTRRPR